MYMAMPSQMLAAMNDYLDELINEHKADPVFAEEWKLSEARIALATVPNDVQSDQGQFQRVKLDRCSNVGEAAQST